MRVRLASEAAARFDLYVELLCLEAVDRAVVEYFDRNARAFDLRWLFFETRRKKAQTRRNKR